MARIIVDCTHTFHTGAGTGIQRLVRQFADALLELAHESPLPVIPVRIEHADLIPLPLSNGHVAFPRSKSAREAITAPDPRIEAARGIGRRVNRLLRSRALGAWLEAGPNEAGLLRRMEKRASTPDGAALRLSSDDILLCLDSSWAYDIRTALEAAGSAGATRIAILCDVFPLTRPEWFMEGTRRQFEGWIRMLLSRVEGIVGISQATCDDLERLVAARRLGNARLPRCSAVHLGAEIASPGTLPVREALRESLAPGRPPAFLGVGTLEPRKNVDYALDIFDQLLARKLDFQWHIAGAPGWFTDHTAHRILSHPQLDKRLFWWRDLSDEEMTWCYQSAAALVATSLAEGFGLPPVEARLHGLPVFASDIPVFREVLDGEARYLPLSSASLAAAALEDFLTRTLPASSRREPSRIARSWKEAAGDLLETALRFHRERQGAAGRAA